MGGRSSSWGRGLEAARVARHTIAIIAIIAILVERWFPGYWGGGHAASPLHPTNVLPLVMDRALPTAALCILLLILIWTLFFVLWLLIVVSLICWTLLVVTVSLMHSITIYRNNQPPFLDVVNTQFARIGNILGWKNACGQWCLARWLASWDQQDVSASLWTQGPMSSASSNHRCLVFTPMGSY